MADSQWDGILVARKVKGDLPQMGARLLGLLDQVLEPGLLVARLLQLRDGPQHSLRDRRPTNRVGEREDVLLDLGREAEQVHDLGARVVPSRRAMATPERERSASLLSRLIQGAFAGVLGAQPSVFARLRGMQCNKR